jgi:hypothetical protein
LDLQIEDLRNRPADHPGDDVTAAALRQQLDAAMAALLAYKKLHEEGLGLTGLLQAYYAGRYAWVVHGMHPGMLESVPPDRVLTSARETFDAGFDLAAKYLPKSERLDDLRVLAKRLRWSRSEKPGAGDSADRAT